jgi:choice-of-anchor A domain-containing protein
MWRSKMNNPNAVYTGFMKGLGAAALLLLAAPGATAGTIGPDAFGYVASDATTYSFVDIAATGVAVLRGADDDKAEVNLGFTFQFYGKNFTSLCVSTNGLISLGGCNVAFANQDLTTTSPQGDLPSIAPFWTDLTFAAPGAGAVYYQTLGAPGNRQFVVQWNNAYPINAPEGITFQVIFYESSHRILFQYKDVTAAGSPASLGGQATIGIRDTNGQANGRRVQWSYNAPVLKNGLALEFEPLGASPVNLGAAGPRYWAVLSLGRPTALSISGNATVTGSVPHVGGAASSAVAITGAAQINGKLWRSSASTLTKSGKSVIAGGVVTGPAADAMLQQAVTDALMASTTAAALGPTLPGPSTINITNPSGSLTITGGPGLNVLRLTDLTITNATVTLNAPAGATFVINVSGRFVLSGPSSIRLAGGLMPFSVIYNVTGTGADISITGGAPDPLVQTQVNGVILAPNRNIYIAADRPIIGEVIGGGAKLTIEGNAAVNNPF